MPISNDKIVAFQKPIAALPDKPNTLLTAQELKEYFDSSPEELRVKLNALIDNLLSTTDGDSGADNIGISPITDLNGATVQAVLSDLRNKLKSTTDGSSGADFVKATGITGLTGDTVQALLEALKAYIDTHKTSADHDGRYYTESEINAKVSSTNGAIASINGIANAAGNIDLVAGTGIAISPDNTNKTITLSATGDMLPGAHAYTHATGGTDPLTPADIGAETPAGAQAKVDTHAAQTATISTLGHVKHAVLTANLDTTWSGTSAPYTKTVSVSGILSTDTPIIDVVMSGTYSTDTALIEAWGYIYRAVTADGSITFYATEMPTVALPIQIRVVR